MTWRWAVGLLIVAITAVTCGSPTSLGPVRPIAEIGSANAFQCGTTQPVDRPRPSERRPTPGMIPDGFTPAAAILCEGGDTVEPDGTVTHREQRREGDFSTAIRLLNEPSERALAADLCPMYSIVEPPQFWLVDTRGRAVEPTLPIGECGLSKLGGIDAILKLRVVDVVEYRDPLLARPRLSLSSCAPHFTPPDEGTEPAVGLTVGYVYCLFDGTSVKGTTDEMRLPIEDLPPAEPCSLVATRTAVTTYVSPGPLNVRSLTVELDGCRRVIPDGYAPLQASDSMLAAFR
ncbi:hypothetical protein [Rhodococcus cercidiphylli]|uniref:Lipoprotein n=1 Tax=Rhodococcus cercidiphylli TaxID=489916 RepID=A0ABU4B407_9NOCA|nr:hypothetical protein [Rhodococcus cercidiphylli]MDV6233234.1 hypothetical protein [Rhodococcus cercidiphylli]